MGLNFSSQTTHKFINKTVVSFMEKYFRIFALVTLGLFVFSSGIYLLPAGASAATDGFPLKDLQFNDVLRILNVLVTWIFTIFLITSVVFVIFAAFRFLVHGADPAEIKKATHMLVYAAIAMAVALSSLGARSLVENVLGVTGSAGTPTAGGNGLGSNGEYNFGTGGLGNNIFTTKGLPGSGVNYPTGFTLNPLTGKITDSNGSTYNPQNNTVYTVDGNSYTPTGATQTATPNQTSGGDE